MALSCVTAEDVLKTVKDEKVQMIDLRFTVSLPKTTSDRIDGVVRQGSDTQQYSRSARSAVY